MSLDDAGSRKTGNGRSTDEGEGNRDVRMRVDHVGIAVESIERAQPVLGAFGAERLVEESLDEFTWAYYRLGNGSRIELIEPARDVGGDESAEGRGDGADGDAGEGGGSGDGSFLTDFLDRYGPGLHHVTLEVTDLNRAIGQVEAAGLRVVDRADEDDWKEAFVSPHNPTGTLFQLMEYREGYATNRGPGPDLFVGGQPLGDGNE